MEISTHSPQPAAGNGSAGPATATASRGAAGWNTSRPHRWTTGRTLRTGGRCRRSRRPGPPPRGARPRRLSPAPWTGPPDHPPIPGSSPAPCPRRPRERRHTGNSGESPRPRRGKRPAPRTRPCRTRRCRRCIRAAHRVRVVALLARADVRRPRRRRPPSRQGEVERAGGGVSLLVPRIRNVYTARPWCCSTAPGARRERWSPASWSHALRYATALRARRRVERERERRADRRDRIDADAPRRRRRAETAERPRPPAVLPVDHFSR